MRDEGGLDLDTGRTTTPWQTPDGRLLRGSEAMEVGWDDDRGGLLHLAPQDTSVKLLALSDAKDFQDATVKAKERFHLLRRSLEAAIPGRQCRFVAVLTGRRNLAVIEISEFSRAECILQWSLGAVRIQNDEIHVDSYLLLLNGADSPGTPPPEAGRRAGIDKPGESSKATNPGDPRR